MSTAAATTAATTDRRNVAVGVVAGFIARAHALDSHFTDHLVTFTTARHRAGISAARALGDARKVARSFKRIQTGVQP